MDVGVEDTANDWFNLDWVAVEDTEMLDELASSA